MQSDVHTGFVDWQPQQQQQDVDDGCAGRYHDVDDDSSSVPSAMSDRREDIGAGESIRVAGCSGCSSWWASGTGAVRGTDLGTCW